MDKLRPIALLLCLALLSGCAAAPDTVPESVPPAAQTDAEPESAVPAGDTETESPPAEPDAEEPETPETPPDGEENADLPETGTDAPPEETPAGESDPPAAPVQEPDSPAAPAEPPVPPASADPGPWETEEGLYYIQEDGTCLTGGTVGYLTFGADGRYTSGDPELDAGIDDLIAAVCPDLTVDSESRLRALYNHIRDNYRYLSMEHYEAGSTDWGNSAALTMLSQGKGNCYNFTALFTACARRLGYQAYNVAGHEYSPDNDHAWTMIDWPDGVTYLFDVQLEWAYLYQYSNRPKIDMFKASGGNGSYNGFAYYFP